MALRDQGLFQRVADRLNRYDWLVAERQGRLIDSDQSASMEKKKVEGYF